MCGLFRPSSFIVVYLPVSPTSAMFFGIFPIDVAAISVPSFNSVLKTVDLVEMIKIPIKIITIALRLIGYCEGLHGYNSDARITICKSLGIQIKLFTHQV